MVIFFVLQVVSNSFSVLFFDIRLLSTTFALQNYNNKFNFKIQFNHYEQKTYLSSLCPNLCVGTW